MPEEAVIVDAVRTRRELGADLARVNVNGGGISADLTGRVRLPRK